MSFKKDIQRNVIAFLSKSTDKKYVVIESDDWGSIRMPSINAFDQMVKKGVNISKDPFNKYDTLASEQDLSLLFEMLSSIKDSKGNSPIITANAVTANPDFEKIKADNFKKYHYEPITETFKKYPNHSKSFSMWKEGIDNNLFYPQFHGREHLNINSWMKMLANNDKDFLTAFNFGVFGINKKSKIDRRYNCMATFDVNKLGDSEMHQKIIESGLNMFYELFGYQSKSFIAPTYVWSEHIEDVLDKLNVKYLQGFNYQLIPIPGKINYKRKFHYTGQKNRIGQTYLVRNAFFEPSLYPSDWKGEVLKRAEIAFRWKSPLIISSHRLNFIGELYPENRDRNLKLLNETLNALLKKWPDIEFIHSSRLGDILNEK